MVKFMQDFKDKSFPNLVVKKNYLGFKNGVLNIENCKFTREENFEDDFIVRKYFDQNFPEETDDPNNIPTPPFDYVLNYQFEHKVVNFIYVCFGRLFGIRDGWGFMLYFLGEAGCGKSIIIHIMSACFDKIGTIGDSYELAFGLSGLFHKDLVVCHELPRNISKLMPQTTFQACVMLDSVAISTKGQTSFSTEWTAPLLFAGNWLPDDIDKGRVTRRVMEANFERIPEERDT
ncbi:hypothetical protein BDK51DRAFT_50188 [Blyttiomyces helicus]|uniref:NrS-1 polymerase-like helicase domain-containing protein n=1 Tax=Blyttiomyces helicus TaxID=388810 RepID=A0A4P9WPQ9_9FUNG|nr:hypothetical protein BDK51DRAFT_50188 [Blyttiomyces helicus]|eukprot:RKO93250.1 hypothetical protein BDK51DRAFT_50188 [Blyttiomyces helicus]